MDADSCDAAVPDLVPVDSEPSPAMPQVQTTSTATAISAVVAAAEPVPAVSRETPRVAVAHSGAAGEAADARKLWESALDQLEDMTADFGRGYSTVAFADPERLVVSFRPEYNLQRSSCERPDRKQKIEQALSRTAGRIIRVEFVALAVESKPAERKAGPVSRVARIREREKHPMVQQARTMFDAEITDVIEPKSENS